MNSKLRAGVDALKVEGSGDSSRGVGAPCPDIGRSEVAQWQSQLERWMKEDLRGVCFPERQGTWEGPSRCRKIQLSKQDVGRQKRLQGLFSPSDF